MTTYREANSIYLVLWAWNFALVLKVYEWSILNRNSWMIKLTFSVFGQIATKTTYKGCEINIFCDKLNSTRKKQKVKSGKK